MMKALARRTIVVVGLVAAGGCSTGVGGGFRIVNEDTRFSESVTASVRSENNRISNKSVAGGTHLNLISNYGISINPGVTTTPAGERMYRLDVVNLTYYDTKSGRPNSLGTMRKLAVIADGDLMTFDLAGSGGAWSDRVEYNTITHSASSDIVESGSAVLTAAEYERIANAKTLAVKIEGTRAEVTYEKGEILPSWQENLRAFFAEYGPGPISRETDPLPAATP